jgi:hypothetical protein
LTNARVLGDGCRPFPGYHLSYPNKRQAPPHTLQTEAFSYRSSVTNDPKRDAIVTTPWLRALGAVVLKGGVHGMFQDFGHG